MIKPLAVISTLRLAAMSARLSFHLPPPLRGRGGEGGSAPWLVLWFSDRSRRLVAEALDQNAAALAVGDEAGALRTRRLFGALSRLAARAAVMPPERGILGAPGMA
ncbi:MAG: hypothetical protein WAL02_13540, partial [Rhodoplanes sp.]